eukprot:363590-Chlamydomonas_euryale.AAC.1
MARRNARPLPLLQPAAAQLRTPRLSLTGARACAQRRDCWVEPSGFCRPIDLQNRRTLASVRRSLARFSADADLAASSPSVDH